MDTRVKPAYDITALQCSVEETLHRVRDTILYFVSGQPLSAAVGNALSPGTTASCL